MQAEVDIGQLLDVIVLHVVIVFDIPLFRTREIHKIELGLSHHLDSIGILQLLLQEYLQ